jgi:hypothetical protein
MQFVWLSGSDCYGNQENQRAKVSVAAQIPGLPRVYTLENKRSHTSFAVGSFAKDGISGYCAYQEMVKADIGEVVAAIHIAGLGTGGELKEHSQHGALSHAFGIHNL